MKTALLICASNSKEKANNSLNELKNLLKTLNIKEIARVVQLSSFNNKTYIGSGKIEEIEQIEEIKHPDYIVFDDELSPAQLFNLDSIFKSSILDRTYIILEIFRKRATTLEAKLEIKIANLKYLYPRLKTIHEGFDRQGGQIGSKGSGETQLELDKRFIQKQIIDSQNKLNKILLRKRQEIKKRKDNNIKTIALVGYTNAGKSSTMNALISYLNKYENKNNLIQKNVEAENILFKTLSTSVRKFTYKNISFLLSDTIGFIDKLPPQLISSFMTTLEEVKNADLIIHVLDVADKNINKHFNSTLNTLSYLNVSNTKALILLNKVDLIEGNATFKINNFDFLPYSNKNEKYQFDVLEYIYNYLLKDYVLMDLSVPFADQKTIHIIEEKTNIINKTFFNDYTLYKLYSPKAYVKMLSLYKDNNIVQ